MKLFSALIMVALVAVSGCTTRMTDFTIISTKNHQVNVPETAKGSRVYGEDMAVWILYVPLGMPSVKTAIDNAIESAGPGYDALIDGVVNRHLVYFVVGFVHGYKVEGTPIKTSSLTAELLRQGRNPERALAEMNILYHSAAGKSNNASLAQLGQ